MRSLIFLIILAAASYQGYTMLTQESLVAYDEAGNPITMVFTSSDVSLSKSVIRMMEERGIDAIEYDVKHDPEAQERYRSIGGLYIPHIISGSISRPVGDIEDAVSILAQNYGYEVLTRSEQLAHDTHFYDDGSPRLVMYRRDNCGYCVKARNYFESNGIEFLSRDIWKNVTAERDFKILNGGGTPLIYYGYKRVRGWNEKRVVEILEGV